MTDIPEKKCNDCGDSKPVIAKYWHRSRCRPDGFLEKCKECNNKRARKRKRERKNNTHNHCGDSDKTKYNHRPSKDDQPPTPDRMSVSSCCKARMPDINMLASVFRCPVCFSSCIARFSIDAASMVEQAREGFTVTIGSQWCAAFEKAAEEQGVDMDGITIEEVADDESKFELIDIYDVSARGEVV